MLPMVRTSKAVLLPVRLNCCSALLLLLATVTRPVMGSKATPRTEPGVTMKLVRLKVYCGATSGANTNKSCCEPVDHVTAKLPSGRVAM
jgi:hypothetical protein